MESIGEYDPSQPSITLAQPQEENLINSTTGGENRGGWERLYQGPSNFGYNQSLLWHLLFSLPLKGAQGHGGIENGLIEVDTKKLSTKRTEINAEDITVN